MTVARQSTEDHAARTAARKAVNMGVLMATRGRPDVTMGGCTSGQAVRKEVIGRSEPYRRLVAALPCAYCKISGYSQAAHPPPTAKGRKESDEDCFPLCCTRPGVLGCHAEFDQYRLLPASSMREQAKQWAAATRATIRRNGQMPKGLEKKE